MGPESFHWWRGRGPNSSAFWVALGFFFYTQMYLQTFGSELVCVTQVFRMSFCWVGKGMMHCLLIVYAQNCVVI